MSAAPEMFLRSPLSRVCSRSRSFILQKSPKQFSFHTRFIVRHKDVLLSELVSWRVTVLQRASGTNSTRCCWTWVALASASYCHFPERKNLSQQHYNKLSKRNAGKRFWRTWKLPITCALTWHQTFDADCFLDETLPSMWGHAMVIRLTYPCQNLPYEMYLMLRVIHNNKPCIRNLVDLLPQRRISCCLLRVVRGQHGDIPCFIVSRLDD